MIKLFALGFMLLLTGCSQTGFKSSEVPATLARHCVSEQARTGLAYEECVNQELDETLR